MKTAMQPVKRGFTDAARAAALAARQAKARLPKGDGFEVFSVRGSDGAAAFTWEIRRFGGVTVEVGDETFATQAEALRAGRHALARRFRGQDGPRGANRSRPAAVGAEP